MTLYEIIFEPLGIRSLKLPTPKGRGKNYRKMAKQWDWRAFFGGGGAWFCLSSKVGIQLKIFIIFTIKRRFWNSWKWGRGGLECFQLTVTFPFKFPPIPHWGWKYCGVPGPSPDAEGQVFLRKSMTGWKKIMINKFHEPPPLILLHQSSRWRMNVMCTGL